MKPIAITTGDPAGIGPDIVVKMLQQPPTTAIKIIGSTELLHTRAKQLKLPIPQFADIIDVPLDKPCIAGQADPSFAAYTLRLLQIASEGCINKQFHAMVTCPVNKAIINRAGFHFSGHTEWLSQQANVTQTVMMFVLKQLRVALFSTHIPLARVATMLERDRLTHCIGIIVDNLKTLFNIASPRLAICGLNPHAGESGLLGSEEIETISPVIKQFRSKNTTLLGPIPADTAFTPHMMAQYDAVLTLYHDQGLPVVKALDFDKAVNITLGLPFIRTSVDHGTAYNLAGTGLARAANLLSAIRLASKLRLDNE